MRKDSIYQNTKCGVIYWKQTEQEVYPLEIMVGSTKVLDQPNFHPQDLLNENYR